MLCIYESISCHALHGCVGLSTCQTRSMPPSASSTGKPAARRSALESQLQHLEEQLGQLELDNAKLQHRQEVLLHLCLSTQWLLSIMSVNGPRLEGPLHTDLCSSTRSAVEQVERTSSSLLEGIQNGPLALQQPYFHISSLDELMSTCLMDGSCLSVLEYSLAGIHAAPEQYACWAGAGMQQLNLEEQRVRGGYTHIQPSCCNRVMWCCTHTPQVPSTMS